MHDPLAPLLADGVIEGVVARLKSGKEADIYLVEHAGQVVAAKVYKSRQTRSFRNNAAYKEGRLVRDTRMQRAMDRGSRFGQAASEEAWKAKEAEALHKLHAAGVRVPQPVMYYEGVLLMELVLDAEGRPAPRLVDAHVPADLATAYYADLRQQAVRMLACDLIHGDLSPYNVLLAWNGPTVIDFPQVVGAAHNSQAEHFFHRDLQSIWRFLASADPRLRGAAHDAREIWRAYVRRELTPDFVPTGEAAERGHPAAGHGGGPGGRGRHRGRERGGDRPRQAHAGAPPAGRAHPGTEAHSRAAAHGAPLAERGRPPRSEPRAAPPREPGPQAPQTPGGRPGRRRRRRRHRRFD